ncbi:unnamed protein product [Prorocentrum cordatum]|uniref:Uncharacterized protein n=1 Tax=Prorocentrum cordatum TaxID=2364126 RepID=A0ABN9T877_9DINO|nr:unnamed protein product [Polarella glacialis]
MKGLLVFGTMIFVAIFGFLWASTGSGTPKTALDETLVLGEAWWDPGPRSPLDHFPHARTPFIPFFTTQSLDAIRVAKVASELDYISPMARAGHVFSAPLSPRSIAL